MAMTPQDMRDVLANIQYKRGHEFICRPLEGDSENRYFLQLSASIPFPPPMRGSKIWKGRKWILSPHITLSELVLTAFKACITFEEHECRESFLFRGQKVCGPHIDMHQLAHLMAEGLLGEDTRA